MHDQGGFFCQLTGIGQVFSFTFAQTFKNRANIISLIVMLVLSLGSVPFGSMMFGSASYTQEEDSSVVEEADYEGPYSQAQLDYLRGQGFSEEAIEAIQSGIEISAWDSLENYEDYLEHVGTASEREQKLKEAEQESAIQSGMMLVQQIYAMVLMMLCVLSCSFIVRAVIEEKTSKLVDLLMVSVRPMALLLGKVLAMMVYVICMLMISGIGAFISYKIFGETTDTSYLNTITMSGLSFGLQMVKLLGVMLVTAVLGYLTYGILSGVLGAGCVTLEDSGSAMGVAMIFIFAGYFVSMPSTFISGHVGQILISILPVISMFTAPVQYIYGHIGIGVLAISWLIQGLCVFGLTVLAGKVYRDLIIYNGKKRKIGEILSMARKGVA